MLNVDTPSSKFVCNRISINFQLLLPFLLECSDGRCLHIFRSCSFWCRHCWVWRETWICVLHRVYRPRPIWVAWHAEVISSTWLWVTLHWCKCKRSLHRLLWLCLQWVSAVLWMAHSNGLMRYCWLRQACLPQHHRALYWVSLISFLSHFHLLSFLLCIH